ncbi:molybdopterin synthase sulfur carrier subunit [Sphingobium yanoikuyae]|jgi:molybdopterin synthase sulfur carrier subunit|uniref:Molybdopterin synthase sulfur carrier subunit n=1 Tax=Sphingobium yanoikuyae TaxID=13690 RepID=A0A177JPX5_SPHYA|nr:MoaD/ThiS family protein [Sphingobium yanoikuyae]OAH42937.1 molybdopterin synthase sulfur carrier subunit [Sphingobium yanoikuyae]PZU69636.1 MAG: MoaD/ThiS family protein [Sphingobium sp.]
MAAVTLVYFAWVREAIGRDEEQVDLLSPDETIAGLVGRLAGRGGGYAEALADPDRLRAALDQQFVGFDQAIGTARELALFPPVTGG